MNEDRPKFKAETTAQALERVPELRRLFCSMAPERMYLTTSTLPEYMELVDSIPGYELTGVAPMTKGTGFMSTFRRVPLPGDAVRVDVEHDKAPITGAAN